MCGFLCGSVCLCVSMCVTVSILRNWRFNCPGLFLDEIWKFDNSVTNQTVTIYSIFYSFYFKSGMCVGVFVCGCVCDCLSQYWFFFSVSFWNFLSFFLRWSFNINSIQGLEFKFIDYEQDFNDFEIHLTIKNATPVAGPSNMKGLILLSLIFFIFFCFIFNHHISLSHIDWGVW